MIETLNRNGWNEPPDSLEKVVRIIHICGVESFLTGVKNSGKTSLAEITKDDLEYFIEQEQDRGIMISTVRTKLNFVNAFIRHWIEEGIIGAEVSSSKNPPEAAGHFAAGHGSR